MIWLTLNKKVFIIISIIANELNYIGKIAINIFNFMINLLVYQFMLFASLAKKIILSFVI